MATTLTNQFIDDGGELSTVSQITALSTDPASNLQSELIAFVNDDPASFIEQLQQNNPDSFADVMDVRAFIPDGLIPTVALPTSPISTSPAPTGAVPQIAIEGAPTSLPTNALEPMLGLTSVSGSVQIDLFAMAELLSGNSIATYDSATSEFYQNFLPGIYTDINATLRSQFLEAQELMTFVEVIAMTSDPLVEFEPLLNDLVNDNEDAFINLLGTAPPFDEVVQVNSNEPILTPVSGDVQIRLFAIQALLTGETLDAFESGTNSFYDDFLPQFFFDLETELREQFLDAQELTALVRVNGTCS